MLNVRYAYRNGRSLLYVFCIHLICSYFCTFSESYMDQRSSTSARREGQCSSVANNISKTWPQDKRKKFKNGGNFLKRGYASWWEVPEFVPCITGCHQDEAEETFVVIETTATVGWCSHSDMLPIYSTDTIGITPQFIGNLSWLPPTVLPLKRPQTHPWARSIEPGPPPWQCSTQLLNLA